MPLKLLESFPFPVPWGGGGRGWLSNHAGDNYPDDELDEFSVEDWETLRNRVTDSPYRGGLGELEQSTCMHTSGWLYEVQSLLVLFVGEWVSSSLDSFHACLAIASGREQQVILFRCYSTVASLRIHQVSSLAFGLSFKYSSRIALLPLPPLSYNELLGTRERRGHASSSR